MSIRERAPSVVAEPAMTRDGPNAWALTGKGREVHGAIAHETTSV